MSSVAKKVAQLIHDKRDEVETKNRIKSMFPTKKNLLIEQLKIYFDTFYDQVSGYVKEGTYFERQVRAEQNGLENSSVYLYGDKLISLSFVESPEEENTFYKVIVTANESPFSDIPYELKLKYNDGNFSWYHGNKVLTSDTFDEFMNEVIFDPPF